LKMPSVSKLCLLTAFCGLFAFGHAAKAQNYEYSGTYQPNLGQINVTRTLHNNVRTSIARSSAAKAVGIAILDGRADANHPDVKGRLSVSQVYGGRYRFNDSHGSHVAGIAGAGQNSSGIVGVAPTARLFSIPVFDDWGWVAYDLGQTALNRAVSLGAKVANMSYGPMDDGVVFLSGELDLFDDYRSSMVLVRAAGNSGMIVSDEGYAGDASTALSHLLIVGSVDRNNTISYFSNRPGAACIGSAGCDESDKMKNFFIVAPGESILSDVPGRRYSYMSGTSMAAPHVSGAAALVFQQSLARNQVLTPSQVASILKQSARDLGAAGVDEVYGYGLLDVRSALSPVGGVFVARGATVNGGLEAWGNTGFARSSVLGSSRAIEQAMDGLVVFDGFQRSFDVSDTQWVAAESTLAADAVSALQSSLSYRSVQTYWDGSYKLTMLGGDGTAGVADVLSFAADEHQVTAGLGTAKAFFMQVDPAQSHANALGANYFTGAGDAGTALENAMFATGDYQLASNLMVSALYMHAREPLDASAGQAADFLSLGSRLSLADGMSIGMSYGLLREDGQMLGLQSDGALALGDVGMTQLGGLNFNAQMDARTSLSAFAEASVTSATQAEGSMFTAPSNWVGSRMGLAISRNGVLQAGDVVTLSMIKPWQLVDGQVEARVAVGREFDGSVNYESRSVELGTAAIPLDIGFSYVKAGGVLGYGGSIWLRDGDARSLGLDEVSVAASMSVRF
jgi:hypothetical protein